MKNEVPEKKFNDCLAASGFRFTPQREHVYDVLLKKRDHPTAEQVFLRAKDGMPEISMATVYNCLDALVKSGLVRQVNLDRAAARYCPNMREHFHFHCDDCGAVYDIDFDLTSHDSKLGLPKEFRVRRYDISAHGACPNCSEKKNK